MPAHARVDDEQGPHHHQRHCCNQMRYPTDRWYPYRRPRLGGFRMIRTATRNAIGGNSDSRSSAQAPSSTGSLPAPGRPG
jgi:hypothetical protein